MNRDYKISCCVPACTNTTTNSPNKVFVHIHQDLKIKLCRDLGLNYKSSSRMYSCEDHLDLEEDLENYFYWKLMKSRKPKLKSSVELRNVKKQNVDPTKCKGHSLKIDPPQKAIDAAIQCEIDVDYKRKSAITYETKQNFSPSLDETTSFESVCPSMYGGTCTTTETEVATKHKDYIYRKTILEVIKNKPKLYIGLPKQYFWLISHIASQDKSITELDIIMTLLKLKQNDTVSRICDQFEISRQTFSSAFPLCIKVLATFFQNSVYMPTPLQIKQNLPFAFHIRYSNVQLILDAFEIEIEKPHHPMHQSQTWSQYKHCNTVKYLIGCTPNGFVSYISNGYGGRISDKALVEVNNLIESLHFNSVVMADRGFKEIETYLMTRNIKLLRPPSVFSNSKPTKEEVIQSKVIASLRVHIERVIRRLREFRFLKPHSVVNHKHVAYMDHMVMIACGLINLQNEIINRD